MAKQEYPKWLYHATEPSRLAADAEKHAEMGPGWFESPTEVNDPYGIPAKASGPVIATPLDIPTAPAEAETVDDAEAKSLYASDAKTVIAKLAGCSPEVLLRVQTLEAQNPRGARKSVLVAVEKLLPPAPVTS